MRVREPRERWILGLCLWGALFGGIPLVMLVLTVRAGGGGVGAVGGPAPPLVLLLFPTIAAVVVGMGLRRWRRSGFTVTSEGLAGAHDAERDVVPWGVVDRLEWRDAGPTSTVEVNDRPLPSGPALFAVLTDGRVLRVMQSCAPRERQRRRIHAQLDEAYRRGVVPVHLDRRVHPEGGPVVGVPDGDHGDVAVTRWSSSGRGRAVPGAGRSTPWHALSEQLGRILGGRDRAADARSAGTGSDRPGDAPTDRDDDGDTPAWPTG